MLLGQPCLHPEGQAVESHTGSTCNQGARTPGDQRQQPTSLVRDQQSMAQTRPGAQGPKSLGSAQAQQGACYPLERPELPKSHPTSTTPAMQPRNYHTLTLWEIHFEAIKEPTTLPWRAQVERRDDGLQSLQPDANGLMVVQGSEEYLTWSPTKSWTFNCS